MTSLADTPLAELLLARGLVGKPILAEALAHVRSQRGQDPHLSLGLFLLQRGVLPANVIESALRHLAGQEGAPARPAAGDKAWGHVSTLEDAPAPVEPAQAERLGPYRLLRKLAEGGMGAVYEVEHESMGGRFALKTIKRDACELLGEDSLVRLQREARLTAAVEHPQVVKIHAASFEGETPYVVQDLLVGGSLQGRVERGGRLTPAQAVDLVARLAEGLAAAHEHEILHRDLKPDNVLFNERDEPVIVDFGLARRLGQNTIDLTQTGEILGTPSYMAPEQAMDASQAGAPADVYALGAILYFCLEGRPPFRGDTVLETLSLVLTSPPPLAESAPPGLAEAITRLLAKEPGERPLAGEVAGLLRASLAAGPRGPKLNFVLAAVALLLLGGVAGALLSRSAAPAPTPTRSLAQESPQATLRATPSAEVQLLLSQLQEGKDTHRGAFAALDLLRLAPELPEAELARREVRRLRRTPLATLPPLVGHRNLAWLSSDKVAGATHEALFTLDLRAPSLEWTREEVLPERLPSRIEAGAGQAWLSLAKPNQAIWDLTPGREGQVLSPLPEWKMRNPAVVALALSPSGRWALGGGAGDLVLYDLQSRRASGHLRLAYLPNVHDVQVEKLRFLDEEFACGLLNQRHKMPHDPQPTAAMGEVFLVRLVEGRLEHVGTQKLGMAGHALAVGEGKIYAGGEGGPFYGFVVSDFAEGAEGIVGEKIGEREESIRRTVAVAWISPNELIAARDSSEGRDRFTQLGRWRRGGDSKPWRFSEITRGQRLREILYLREERLLLLSARQSRNLPGPAGSVWYVGERDE